MKGGTRNATRAAADRQELASAIEDVEKLPQVEREDYSSSLWKIAGAKAVLYEITDDRCETTDLITAAAGPEVGGSAAMITEETFTG